MSVQTNKSIRSWVDDGDIVMVPRDNDRINNGSVDVSLGRFIARIRQSFYPARSTDRLARVAPQREFEVNRLRGDEVFYIEDVVKENDGVISIRSGERILAHTHEFIGARKFHLPEMRAKSSMARWGLTVCACAGWGDVGYFNRWTMEIFNMNPNTVRIDIGTLVAQIVFHFVETPDAGTLYNQPGAGHYQQGDDLEAMVRDWRPESMLPKPLKKIVNAPLNDVDRDGV